MSWLEIVLTVVIPFGGGGLAIFLSYPAWQWLKRRRHGR